MTQASFSEAVRSAIPEVKFFDGPYPGPAPEGHTEVGFQLTPTPHGFRLTIKIGPHRPNHFTFSSEEEAAEFLGRMFADAKS